MKHSLEIERGEETQQAKRRCIENLEQELTDMEHQHEALSNQDASAQQNIELTDHQQQGMAEMELQMAQTDALSDMPTDDTEFSSDGSYTDSDSCDNSIESDENTDDTEPQANELYDGEENLVEPIEEVHQPQVFDQNDIVDWEFLDDDAIQELIDAEFHDDDGYESDDDESSGEEEEEVVQQYVQDAVDLDDADMGVNNEVWDQLCGDEGYSSDYDHASHQEEIINEQYHQVMVQHQQNIAQLQLQLEEVDNQLEYLNQLYAQYYNALQNTDSEEDEATDDEHVWPTSEEEN